jgi:hypothetical protein
VPADYVTYEILGNRSYSGITDMIPDAINDIDDCNYNCNETLHISEFQNLDEDSVQVGTNITNLYVINITKKPFLPYPYTQERAVIAMEQQVFLHCIKDFFQSNFAFLKRVFDPGIMLYQFLLFIFFC